MSVWVFARRSSAQSKVAIDETFILLHPPLPFSRCFNVDGEGMPVK